MSQTGSKKRVLGILHLVGENDLGTNTKGYADMVCVPMYAITRGTLRPKYFFNSIK